METSEENIQFVERESRESTLISTLFFNHVERAWRMNLVCGRVSKKMGRDFLETMRSILATCTDDVVRLATPDTLPKIPMV